MPLRDSGDAKLQPNYCISTHSGAAKRAANAINQIDALASSLPLFPVSINEFCRRKKDQICISPPLPVAQIKCDCQGG